MDTVAISRELIGHMGGEKNIIRAEACMTRLRVSVRDIEKVDIDAIKNVEGVMGVVNAETVQVVFGPGTVNKVLQSFRGLLESDSGKTKEKKQPVQAFLKHIANIFVPLLAGIIAAGMINGITNAINVANGDAWSGLWWYESIRTIGWAVFTYLPIFVGYNAAKEFGGTPILGGLAGAVCVANSGMPLLQLFGDEPIVLPMTNEPFNPASGGIVAAVIAGALFAFLEKKIRKRMPGVIDTFISPLLVVVIGVFALVVVIQPLSAVLSKGLYIALDFIYSHLGAPGGFLLAALFLPLVSVGLHQALTPIHVMLSDPAGITGGINHLLPILMMAGGGQVGAGLAIYLKTKNKKLKKIIRDGIPVGMLGVAEPLMYGVTLPLGRSFVTSCIGAGVGGAVASLFHLGAVSQGVSGFFGALIIEPGQEVWFIISMLCAYAGGFVATWFFGIDEKRIAEVYGDESGEADSIEMEADASGEEKALPAGEQNADIFEIGSPVNGTIIPIREVDDPVFSEEVTGPGVAVIPEDGRFYAPCDGELAMLFPTGHAYGIAGPDGVELFVHIGIDTVKLDGQFFTLHAEQGDEVKKGDLIVEVDLEGVKNAGYETVTPVVVSGTGVYSDIEKLQGEVRRGEAVMRLNQ